MAKITRKKIVIALALLVVIAGTNTVTYLVASNHDTNSGQAIITNIDSKKDSQAEILNKISDASSGTNSIPISDLHSKTNELKGRTVTVAGVVYESLQDKAVFLGQPGDKPVAIELTFDNFDKKDLDLGTTYTITGTLVQSEGQPAKVSVVSAKKF